MGRVRHKWPLGSKYEGGEEYTPDSGIEVVQNWPEPELRGFGVVRDKSGNIKLDIRANGPGGIVKDKNGNIKIDPIKD